MKLKARVLVLALSVSFIFALVLGLVFSFSLAGIRNYVLAISGKLGDNAADISAYALEGQLTGKVTRVAQNMAFVLDEKLTRIENHTRTTADIAGRIYTNREAYHPRPIPFVAAGEMTSCEPYLHIASGVSLAEIRDDAYLLGNIADTLRQITVIDRRIINSAVVSSRGYIISMDTLPWLLADFDPRDCLWFSNAEEKMELHWTSPYIDIQSRSFVISCVMPFFDRSGGQSIFMGVTRNAVLLSDFSRILDSYMERMRDYMFLLDGSGLKIFSSNGVQISAGMDGKLEGENFLYSDDPHLRSLGLSMVTGATGITELVMNGIPVFVAYAPVKTLGWSLGVAIPVKEINAPVLMIEQHIHSLTSQAIGYMDRRIFLFAGVMAAILLLGLFAAAVFSIRFTTKLAGPILALNEGVREVSAGNLNREVSVKTGDELEELASSFNIMTGRLREQIDKISRAAIEKERMSSELDAAARIQTSMLPGKFPPFAGKKNDFDLFAAIYPAKEVGGDFYDFFFIDKDHFVIMVADVSGKGIPAAIFMAIAKTLIKNNLKNAHEPDISMGNINRQLCNINSQAMFVTIWLGVLQLSTGRLKFINAGHNPPLIKRGGNNFQLLKTPPDLVLAAMSDTLYRCREVQLEDGDILFLYTDGITEAADKQGNFFGIKGLLSFMDENAGLPPKELLTALRCGLEEYGEQTDDITMLGLRYDRENPARTLCLEAKPAALKKLIKFIGHDLKAGGCPQKIQGQIELAAEEIFINIVNYAYNNNPGEVLIGSAIKSMDGKVTITITFADWGEPFNLLEFEEPDLRLPLEQRKVGGLGILMVKRTMDIISYEYDNGMNHLLIKKSWDAKP